MSAETPLPKLLAKADDPPMRQLAAALALAQTEMQNPARDAENPHFKSKYADLAAVRAAVLPVLAKHGFAVAQLVCETEHGPALRTLLMHAGGGQLESVYPLRPTKPDPQSFGGAVSYARRYALSALVCLATEDDDDGNAASAPGRQQQRQPDRPAGKPAEHRPAATVKEVDGLLHKVAKARGEGWTWDHVADELWRAVGSQAANLDKFQQAELARARSWLDKQLAG